MRAIDEVVQQALEGTLAGLVEAVKGANGAVVEGTPPGEPLAVLAVLHVNPEKEWKHSELSRTLVRNVLDSGEPVMLNYVDDPRFKDGLSLAFRPCSIVAAPIRREGAWWGVLYVDKPIRDGKFYVRDLRVLEEVASRLGQSLQTWDESGTWPPVSLP